jgi:hypothetical protein
MGFVLNFRNLPNLISEGLFVSIRSLFTALKFSAMLGVLFFLPACSSTPAPTAPTGMDYRSYERQKQAADKADRELDRATQSDQKATQ